MVDAEGTVVAGHNQQEIVADGAEEKDSDDDFNSDGDEEVLRSLRDRRVAAMKEEFKQRQEDKVNGHGQYTEITEEQFLPTVTKIKFVIAHFYHKDFERCKIFDMHLRHISKFHTEAKFVYIDAEKCPFFVAKL